MLSRRDFLRLLALGLAPAACSRSREAAVPLDPDSEAVVNDVHSKLNATRVGRVLPMDSVEALRSAIDSAGRASKSICVAGARHAMGGQQFCTDGLLLDTTPLNRVLNFDPDGGLIEVEAGIQWPELYDYLHSTQADVARPWVVAQKQTGAARLTLGGALAANAHGRALTRKPIIADVESFILLDAAGRELVCSRSENSELFRLAIGGYGLFGVIVSLRLRLVRRQKVERIVDILDVEDAMSAFEERIASGFLYGDYQYAIDENSSDFLRKGILSCYRPVAIDTPIPRQQKGFTLKQWRRLVYYAHTSKSRAFEVYARGYRRSSGQIYWSDSTQLGSYLPDYHLEIDRKMGAAHPATEMISEIYVPRPRLADFMGEVRQDFRLNGVQLIYGTIRLIEQDDECFLAWARQPYACIIFNLHIEHTPSGIRHAAEAFRRLIDMAIARGGSYYLTYHKFATAGQLLACYPQFVEFLRLKRRYDPEERFQSDWYRHYRDLVAETNSETGSI